MLKKNPTILVYDDKAHRLMNKNQDTSLFKEKMSLCKNFIQKKSVPEFHGTRVSEKFVALETKVQNSMEASQSEYYKKISQKFSNPSTSPKCYWNILKKFFKQLKRSLYFTTFSC